MKKIEVFEVVGNTDDIEGRGGAKHIAYFTTAKDAKLGALGKGVMGTPADVERKTLVIYESINEFEKNVERDLRKSALAKLTEEERRVLGV